MKTFFLHIIFVSLLVITFLNGAKAQSGFFVPRNAQIFFNGDSATVFSDVLNEGSIGVGKSALVNFTAQKWVNDAQSLITDETNAGTGTRGVGGVVRFLSFDTTIRQQLNGGYNAATRQGPAFSHLQIQNIKGLELTGSNAKVRNELQFKQGLVYVNDNILLVGDGTPGKISGYDSLHYVVTNNQLNEGFLLRESITSQDGVVVFPVGSNENSYTPLGLRSGVQQADNFYVNVNDGIKKDVIRGNLSSQSVNKTWQAGKQFRPNQDQVHVLLQHNSEDEGSLFASARANAYVSQIQQGSWDVGHPQSSPARGTLTTGQPGANSGLNGRTFEGTIGSESFFSKLTGKGDTTKSITSLWFNGYRIDADFTRVYWRTNPEIHNRYFVVQRKLTNEADFKNIDTLLTKSVNGISNSDLNYEIKDANSYPGVSFYRLMMVDKDSVVTYSNIIAVAGTPGKFKLTLWPNPTPDNFFIGLNGEVSVKAIVIFNAGGQKVYETQVNGRSIISVRGFRPGTYMVSFISATNQIVETKRVVVTGY